MVPLDQKQPQKERLENALILLIVVLWFLFIWPTPYRYHKLGTSDVRSNRFTGRVEYLTSSGWKERGAEIEPTPTPVPLPTTPSLKPPPVPPNPSEEDISHLDGEGGFKADYGDLTTVFEINAYNSATKPIKGEIVVHVVIMKKRGNEILHDRRLRTAIDIAAQSTGDIEVDTGLHIDPSEQTFAWSYEPVQP